MIRIAFEQLGTPLWSMSQGSSAFAYPASNAQGLRLTRSTFCLPSEHRSRCQARSLSLAVPRRMVVHRAGVHRTAIVASSSPADGAADDIIDSDSLFLRGPVPGDRIVRTMSANGEVSVRVMACTGLVAGATRLHRTTPVASAAFGRTLACSLLLASGKKDGETLQIEFRGDGPIRGITAIANGEGCVRGYLGDPRIDLPPNSAGKLDVGKAVGKGILAVVRNSKYAQQPYTGLVPIATGEIAEDVAVYLADSEQTPSALGVGVYVSETGQVTGAGGFLVQLLPGASEESIATVEQNVASLPPVRFGDYSPYFALLLKTLTNTTRNCRIFCLQFGPPLLIIAAKPTEMVRQGKSVDEVCQLIMAGLEPLQVQSSAPRYYCECSAERVKRTVRFLEAS